jgi:hypothetical protein
MVKRPGKRYFSYSSARLTYAAAGPASRWWYRYVPRDRGTYQFYVSFSGDVALVGSTSNLVTVHVR